MVNHFMFYRILLPIFLSHFYPQFFEKLREGVLFYTPSPPSAKVVDSIQMFESISVVVVAIVVIVEVNWLDID